MSTARSPGRNEQLRSLEATIRTDPDIDPSGQQVTVTNRQPDHELDTIIVRVDGSYHHEKGVATTGIVIESNDGNTYRESWVAKEEAISSTETEAEAILDGVKMALEYDPSFLVVYSDCEPVVEKVKRSGRRQDGEVYEEIHNVIGQVEITRFNHIPRERNERADQLAHRGLREQKDRAAAD